MSVYMHGHSLTHVQGPAPHKTWINLSTPCGSRTGMHATPRPSPGALPKCYNKQRAPENHALSSVGGHMQEAHPAVCPPRALHPALWKHKKTEPGNEAGKTKHLSYGLQIAFAVVTQCTTPDGALHPTHTSAYTPHLRACTPRPLPPSSKESSAAATRGRPRRPSPCPSGQLRLARPLCTHARAPPASHDAAARPAHHATPRPVPCRPRLRKRPRAR